MNTRTQWSSSSSRGRGKAQKEPSPRNRQAPPRYGNPTLRAALAQKPKGGTPFGQAERCQIGKWLQDLQSAQKVTPPVPDCFNVF
ncbi:uncharacterized protein DMAD_00527 [Drosophila madeirensis]|uniref:Gag polyprotein n=1 Tax=Drosophila madeirensis TaxID=30013 RepID=A0AAU9FYL3_DROMD